MKLISINIEGERHLERVLAFIIAESPDVLCLQELYDIHIEHFVSLGYSYAFLPMTKRLLEGREVVWGIGLFSRYLIANVLTEYYTRSERGLVFFDRSNFETTIKHGIISASTLVDGTPYTVATTHFPWTPDGDAPCESQKQSMAPFLEYIKTLEPHVICGDFNIPRNLNPLYNELKEHYTDAIPVAYASSLDRSLHHAGKDPLKQKLFTSFMVDYIFTQSPYSAQDVRLEFGISDHAAVVAKVERAD